MEVVKQSAEIIPSLPYLEQIAGAGRVCYQIEEVKSGPKEFVKRIIKRKHWSVLEMAVISLGIELQTYKQYLAFICSDKKYINITSQQRSYVVATASVRAWMEWIERNSTEVLVIADLIAAVIKEEIGLDFTNESCNESSADTDGIEVLSSEDVNGMEPAHRDLHSHVMVRFVTNRAVSHEIVRHRPCAILQESQRYCRYSAGRFGNEVKFICPSIFWKEDSPEYAMWERHCSSSEQLYLKLLKDGSSPQAARTVLPNSTKTELILYANIKEWKHIFKLRADNKDAEPSMREIMIPLQEQFKERGLI